MECVYNTTYLGTVASHLGARSAVVTLVHLTEISRSYLAQEPVEALHAGTLYLGGALYCGSGCYIVKRLS